MTADPAIRSARGTLRQARRALNRAEPFILELGDVLDRARKHRGWSLGRLADEAGVHVNSVYRILNGKAVDVRLDTLVALAGALGYAVVVQAPRAHEPAA